MYTSNVHSIHGIVKTTLTLIKFVSPAKNPSAVMPVPDQVQDDGSDIQKYLNLLANRPKTPSVFLNYNFATLPNFVGPTMGVSSGRSITRMV